MTCSKLAAIALESCKQDNTSVTSAADIKQNQHQICKQHRKQMTETVTCSKLAANALESCKRDNTSDTRADVADVND